MNKLDLEILETEEKLNFLKAQKLNKRASKKVLCSCGAFHSIKDLTLIYQMYYDDNTGSPNGGFWSCGELGFLCEKTKIHNRILFDDYDLSYEDRQTFGKSKKVTFLRLYTDLFKNSVESFDGSGVDDLYGKLPTYNNYYIDKNADKFDLPFTKYTKK